MVYKTLKKASKKFTYFIAVLTLLLVGTGSWVLYNIFSQLSLDILTRLGITNFYYQGIIIIIFVMVILIFTGYGIKKSFERILSK